MLTRKKSIRSRTRLARSKRSKFLTPDLVLYAGQKFRFVASPDDPLSEAEGLRGEFAEMKERHNAEERQFLQRIYGVAARFRRRPGDFERFQVHPFWKQSGQKPKDPSTSKWLLHFIMQATTPNAGNLADKCAVILDGLMQDKVDDSAVAARIEELGGSVPRTRRLRASRRPTAVIRCKAGRLESQRAVDRRRRRRRDSARSSTSPRRRRPCLQRSTWHRAASRRGVV